MRVLPVNAHCSGTITKCYGIVTKPLRKIAGHYGSITFGMTVYYRAVMGCYRTLQSHYGTLRNIAQRYRTIAEALQDTAEHYGALRDVTEALQALWSVTEHCEELRFAKHTHTQPFYGPLGYCLGLSG